MAISKNSSYSMPQPESFPNNVTHWQLDPSRAVFLIHDMQRYFVDFHDTDSELIQTLIKNLVLLKHWAYEQGIPVVYTAQSYQPVEDRVVLNTMWEPTLHIDQQKMIDELSPDPQDIILTKWRYSALKHSDLLQHMQGWDRDQLIIGGIYAHIGCMITAVDAFMSDIQPFLIGDAVADFSEEEHRMALKYIASCCGQVLDTQSLLGHDRNKITKEWLEQRIQKLIEEDDELDPEENLILYGLDSLRIMQFSSELKAQGVSVSFEELGRNPSFSTWWSLIDSKQSVAG